MKKNIIILLILIFLVLTAGFIIFSGSRKRDASSPPAKALTYQNITSPELATQLKAKDFFLVNVHIPFEGDIEKTDASIPFNEIGQYLDKLPPDKNSKIILYCRSGRMSQEAAQALTKLGYTNVYNLTGGMLQWEAKGFPLLQK